MSDEMKKIKQLEEELQDLQTERKVIDKKLKNIELEREVINNKEQEIREEISKIKECGNDYLGQFAIVNNKWGSRQCYMFITSVATEYTGSLAAFSGPHFYIDVDEYHQRTEVSCEHDSAHDMSHISIDDPKDIKIITKEEFIAAFEKFQQRTKELMIAAVNAVPRKKTKSEWKFSDDWYDKIED